MNKIGVSIVLYNNKFEEVERLLNSLFRTQLNIKVYIIDNSPNDNLNVLRDLNVTYIKSNNVGYGAGHNIAIRESFKDGARHHLVVNPDIYFENSVLDILYAFMESHTDIGLIMPKILNVDGTLQYLCKLIPNPINLFGRRFFPLRLLTKMNNKFELRFTEYQKIMEVPYLSGCFMYLRSSVLKDVGLFDEQFFMYPEDIDLSRRINEKYRTIYFPNVSVIHEHKKESYVSTKMLMIHIVNIIKYFNKWGWFIDLKRRKQNKYILNKLSWRK